MKINKIFAISFMVFLPITFMFLPGCSDDKIEEKGESKIPVSIYKINESNVTIPIKTSGKIIAEKEMRLSFKTGGIIEKIYVNEGDYVGKGKLLAEVDLQEINAQVIQAKAAYEKAERDFKRVEKLYGDSVATLEQYQNMKTALEVAKANFEIADFNRSLSTITAPTGGQIYKKFAEEKEIVSPGTPIFLFGSSKNDWEIEAGLTDKVIKKVKIGDTAHVNIDVLPGEKFTAEISEIAGSIDPFTSTYKVKFRFKNKTDKLISGMIASIEIFPASEGFFKIIPIKSLVNADNMTGEVFILNEKDNTVNGRPVNVKEIWNEFVVVESGLENVEYIILDGVEYMYDGAKVEVQSENKNSGEVL